MAVNCWVAPMGILGFGGVILTREVATEVQGNPKSTGPLQDVGYKAKIAKKKPTNLTERTEIAEKRLETFSKIFNKSLWPLRARRAK